jgi:hypothetical protein
LGIRNSDFTQIAGGINPGDPVVTTGGYAVPDGTQIKIEKPGADEKQAADTGEKGAGKGEKDDKAAEAKKPDKPKQKAGPPKKAAPEGKE